MTDRCEKCGGAIPCACDRDGRKARGGDAPRTPGEGHVHVLMPLTVQV